jgi:predicted RNA-binding protein YlqC (UPF0109 family)
MSHNKIDMLKQEHGQSFSISNTTESNNGSIRSIAHGRLETRFLVCSRDAGAIIGKKGSNIQALRQKHQVIIQVPDCDVGFILRDHVHRLNYVFILEIYQGPERVLSIQGDYDACLAAIVDILPTMKDNQRAQNDQSEIRLLVHQSQAGAVIGTFIRSKSCALNMLFRYYSLLFLGKGGERVRELRSKYNVGMKVFVQCLPFSTERVAALRGRADDIERCLRELVGILEQTPARGQTCFYDPYNFDESLSSEYGQ